MSNESTPQVPAEQPKPVLPQFDPSRPPTADDTQQLPTASTSEIPVTPPDTPYAYAASPSQAAPLAGPGVPLSATGLPARAASGSGVGPRWNAKKTAVTAGLAILLTSAGAVAAAAAIPAGSAGDDSGFRGPGGGRNFQFPGGQRGLQNQQGLPNQQGTSPQQLPNLQNGAPGGGLSGLDPNQLSQLDPQDLLQQLGQDSQGDLGTDPFSDDQDQDQDDSGTCASDGARTT